MPTTAPKAHPLILFFKQYLPVLALAALLGALLLPHNAFGKPAPTKQTELGGGAMQIYQSRYYIIHSDLPTDQVKEAVLRMTRMAEEYHTRTQGFSGDVRDRLPFYLFKNSAEYYEAGGIPGSAGVFLQESDGTSKLMAIAGQEMEGQTWHVVQHEGFHQFAHAVIRGELPTWLNEGIAEYFGESLFTGDGFVSGIVPPWRLKRVQAEIKEGRFKSIKDIMLTGQAEWNNNLSILNYDQAWSMVYFLAQGEEGRYQGPFVNFMKLIGRGTPWPMAWKSTFGDAVGFEQRWRDYWLKQPANPTADLYAQAVTATFTSFIARAAAQKQTFDSFDEFLSDAKADKIKVGYTIDDWLPPKLLEQAVEGAGKSQVKFSIQRMPGGPSELVAVLPDGVRLIGSYVLRGRHASHTEVELDDTAAVIKQAQALIDDHKKDRARSLLQRAIRAHPKSPEIAEVRKLLLLTK
jgi:hypothetical protein